jgi:hypothetical protein
MAGGHNPQPGKGVLFINFDKKTEKSPDWKGTLMLSKDYKAGDTLKISGWTRNGAKGQFYSLSEDTWKPPSQAGTYPKEVKNDDDIPW